MQIQSLVEKSRSIRPKNCFRSIELINENHLKPKSAFEGGVNIDPCLKPCLVNIAKSQNFCGYCFVQLLKTFPHTQPPNRRNFLYIFYTYLCTNAQLTLGLLVLYMHIRVKQLTNELRVDLSI